MLNLLREIIFFRIFAADEIVKKSFDFSQSSFLLDIAYDYISEEFDLPVNLIKDKIKKFKEVEEGKVTLFLVKQADIKPGDYERFDLARFWVDLNLFYIVPSMEGFANGLEYTFEIFKSNHENRKKLIEDLKFTYEDYLRQKRQKNKNSGCLGSLLTFIFIICFLIYVV